MEEEPKIPTVTEPEKQKNNQVLIGISAFSLLFSITAIGYSIYNTNFLAKRLQNAINNTQLVASTSTSDESIDLLAKIPADAPTKGNPNATVKVVEFEDFQCPYCKKFFDTSYPAFLSTYVDTNKVLFVHADFPFLGDESTDAAVAAQCAMKQNKFWEYRDLLFKNQASENTGGFRRENLLKFASLLNLDSAEFATCLDDPALKDKITKGYTDAANDNVDGTPSFLVNGTLIKGLNQSKLFSAIDAALSKGKTTN